MVVLGPLVLPRLGLRDGVPSDLRTLVVIPTLLPGQAQIEEQIERLEVYYLANSAGDLRFALLSDWTDAPLESMSEDDELLAVTVEGIARLNRRHGVVSPIFSEAIVRPVEVGVRRPGHRTVRLG